MRLQAPLSFAKMQIRHNRPAFFPEIDKLTKVEFRVEISCLSDGVSRIQVERYTLHPCSAPPWVT